jgi:hypothetical protein
MRRFNVTLDREHAERLDQVCREKRVPRDSFIGEYVRFLVEGEDGVCEAPLRRINEVLTNPRHEYEEKRWSVSTVSVEASQKDEALSPKNPYSFLHLSEGFLEQVAEQLRNEGRPENR